ncbi:MAG: hypothetical protein Q4D14_07890 [Bacteroidales bacterium]|nr:hypothetical protein [Bacteroidales bacterium]
MKEVKGKKMPVHLFDICDELQGDYPKTFKWCGWHPQCRCHATAITADKELRKQWLAEGCPSGFFDQYQIKDAPKNFVQWVGDNKDKISRARSLPYWVQDNLKQKRTTKGSEKKFDLFGVEMRKPSALVMPTKKLTPLEISEQRHAMRTPEEKRIIQEMWNENRKNKLRLMIEEISVEKSVKESLINEVNEINTKVGGKLSKDKFSLIFRKLDRISTIEQKQETILNNPISIAKRRKIEYNQVSKSTTLRTEEEIVDILSGGDITDGSCSSLAFAYCGQKCGLDVLDFRGGISRDFFSETTTINMITSKGYKKISHMCIYDSEKLFEEMLEGKQYYFATGNHAAIIKKENGVKYYLELQSPTKEDNGWHVLNRNVLINRFNASEISSKAVVTNLIEIELLQGDPKFIELLGCINTLEQKQIKGISGMLK